ncbi:hypothetical protein C2G38_2047566 [Gigaspora rosea]|uniref:Uncharacterized protein n=1 Tax=Gigaspora rosea TaxID=44941 RepID=A0A397U8S5_9GLOM|nr:hypothetical protein C2G38_2047566 [Gigaspora rosea]
MSIQNFQENINHAPAELEALLSLLESPKNLENFEPEIEEEDNGAFYNRRAKAESIAEHLYKIRDDCIMPRQFLGTDSENRIEAILSERQGHSLYEFIDGDDPLRPFINFDLSRKRFDKIEPKLSFKEIQDLLCHAF